MLWTRPPIVSWLPDVVPNVYWVAAVYDKLPRGHHGGLPPLKIGPMENPTLRPRRNGSRGCNTGLGPGTERCQICGTNDGNGHILASGLSEAG
jgi:hypothetical protein